MAEIRYFARLAEEVGTRAESVELPEDCHTAADLVALLSARGDPFASALSGETPVLVAINQEMSDIEASIANHDEIAFFPPVTGG